MSAPDSTAAEVLVPYLLEEAGTIHPQDDGLSLLFLLGLGLPPTSSDGTGEHVLREGPFLVANKRP